MHTLIDLIKIQYLWCLLSCVIPLWVIIQDTRRWMGYGSTVIIWEGQSRKAFRGLNYQMIEAGRQDTPLFSDVGKPQPGFALGRAPGSPCCGGRNGPTHRCVNSIKFFSSTCFVTFGRERILLHSYGSAGKITHRMIQYSFRSWDKKRTKTLFYFQQISFPSLEAKAGI